MRQPVPEIVFGLAMATAALWDLRHRRIPNVLTVAILAAGLGARALAGGAPALGSGLAGAGVGFALLFPLFHVRWMGGGDVKLMTAAGAWLGPWPTVWATLIGAALGGLLALVILAAGGAALRAEVLTNMKASFYTMSAPEAPGRPHRHKVPMALALGGAAVGVLLYLGGFHAA